MNLPRNARASAKLLFFMLLILAGAPGVLFWHHQRGVAVKDAPQSAALSPSQNGKTVPASTAANPQVSASGRVASATPPTVGSNAWAGLIGDGKDTNSIRRWAHNELEVQRMLNENDRIYRRQLVTLKETVAAVVERNRLTGAPMRELTLPGLDGQEIRFEVRKAEIGPSGQNGMFSGQVAGRSDSRVTLAFLQGRQAYTILSPADNLYLDVEPHDPGDVIVKSINLAKYGVGMCGNP